MDFIKKNAKAIIAFVMVVIAHVGIALGVDTGIDVGYWIAILGTAVVSGTAVWAVPNKDPNAPQGPK